MPPEGFDKAGAHTGRLKAGADVDREEARQIVRETLRELGIDPEDFQGHQRDMAFVRKQREGAEQVAVWGKRACIMTGIGAFGSGVAWLVVEVIKMVFRAKGGP